MHMGARPYIHETLICAHTLARPLTAFADCYPLCRIDFGRKTRCVRVCLCVSVHSYLMLEWLYACVLCVWCVYCWYSTHHEKHFNYNLGTWIIGAKIRWKIPLSFVQSTVTRVFLSSDVPCFLKVFFFGTHSYILPTSR